MKNPIIYTTTTDKLDLYGLLLPAKGLKAVVLNICGTADNFYDNEFIWEISRALNPLGVSFLSVNNRGSYNLEFYDYGPGVYRNSGASVEIFEECLLDIDAWIKQALSLGYKKIILSGHSLGTEKVVYYMAKGKYRHKISGVILMGFSDSYGHHFRQVKLKDRNNLMAEAKSLVKKGQGNQFLTKPWLAHAGILPQSALSYINFFRDGSELSKAFPLRQGKGLKNYQKIKVPILGFIGDEEEYTIIPIAKAIELLKTENSLAEVYQVKDCDHCFAGKEKEVARLVRNFVKTRLL